MILSAISFLYIPIFVLGAESSENPINITAVQNSLYDIYDIPREYCCYTDEISGFNADGSICLKSKCLSISDLFVNKLRDLRNKMIRHAELTSETTKISEIIIKITEESHSAEEQSQKEHLIKKDIADMKDRLVDALIPYDDLREFFERILRVYSGLFIDAYNIKTFGSSGHRCDAEDLTP